MSHQLMITLIDQADSQRTTGNQYGGAFIATSIGEIRLYRDYKIGNLWSRASRHARSTWKLNGKVISASKLAEALSLEAN